MRELDIKKYLVDKYKPAVISSKKTKTSQDTKLTDYIKREYGLKKADEIGEKATQFNMVSLTKEEGNSFSYRIISMTTDLEEIITGRISITGNALHEIRDNH